MQSEIVVEIEHVNVAGRWEQRKEGSLRMTWVISGWMVLETDSVYVGRHWALLMTRHTCELLIHAFPACASYLRIA